jgi:hypothetical protein
MSPKPPKPTKAPANVPSGTGLIRTALHAGARVAAQTLAAGGAPTIGHFVGDIVNVADALSRSGKKVQESIERIDFSDLQKKLKNSVNELVNSLDLWNKQSAVLRHIGEKIPEIPEALESTAVYLQSVLKNFNTLSQEWEKHPEKFKEFTQKLSKEQENIANVFAKYSDILPEWSKPTTALNNLAESANAASEALKTLETSEKKGGGLFGFLKGGVGGLLALLGSEIALITTEWIRGAALRERISTLAGLTGGYAAGGTPGVYGYEWISTIERMTEAGRKWGYTIEQGTAQLTTFAKTFGFVGDAILNNLQMYSRALGLSVEELISVTAPLREVARIPTAGGLKIDDTRIENVLNKTITLAASLYATGTGQMTYRFLQAVSQVYSEFVRYAGVSLNNSQKTISTLMGILVKTGEIPEELAGVLLSSVGRAIAEPRTTGQEIWMLRTLGWRGGLDEYVRLKMAMERPFEAGPGGVPPVQRILEGLQNEFKRAGISWEVQVLLLRDLFKISWNQAGMLADILKGKGISEAMQELQNFAKEQKAREDMQMHAWQNMAALEPNVVIATLKNIETDVKLHTGFLDAIANVLVKKAGDKEMENLLKRMEEERAKAQVESKVREYMTEQKMPAENITTVINNMKDALTDVLKNTGPNINVTVRAEGEWIKVILQNAKGKEQEIQIRNPQTGG